MRGSTFHDAASQAYLKHLTTLARQLDRQLERSGSSPTNGQVHDLRVSIRRIRAALRFVEKSVRGTAVNHLEFKLKKLGKTLGKRRELDVALDDAHAFHLDDAQLRSLRKKAHLQVKQALPGRKRRKLSRGLERVLTEIETHPEIDFRNAFSELGNKLLPWLDSPLCGEDQIHSFRITMKKTRYALEAVGLSVEPLGQLQDHLGRAHDMEVLSQLIGHYPEVRRLEDMEIARARKLARPVLEFVLKEIGPARLRTAA
jgi:CHAD domain-containing protein